MDYKLTFYRLVGKFEVERTKYVRTKQEANQEFFDHASRSGFSQVQFIDDDDDDDGWTIRVTARTPGGRTGRNIGVIEFGGDFTQE